MPWCPEIVVFFEDALFSWWTFVWPLKLNKRNPLSLRLDLLAILWGVWVNDTEATMAGFQGYRLYLIVWHYFLFILNAILGMEGKNCSLQLLRARWPEVTSEEQMKKHFKDLEERSQLIIQQQGVVKYMIQCICLSVWTLLSNGTHRRIYFGWE